MLGHGLGVEGAGVLEGVAQSRGTATVVVGEKLVEGDDVDQGQLAEELADLLDVHAHLVRDLFVGRAAV